LLILFLGLSYFALSFHPRLRFADPILDVSSQFETDFACLYDRIYGKSGGADILFLGASKTHVTNDVQLIAEAYKAVTGDKLQAFEFDTLISNPGIMYFFLRDYLAHNPAPEMVFLELTAVHPYTESSAVAYIHPLFVELAPPYLYLDVLRSWKLVRNKIFAVSDFLRLLIRHLDASLSRLLLADLRFIVPPGENCAPPDSTVPAFAAGRPGEYTFEGLLDAEMERLLPPFDREEVGRQAALLETYADRPVIRSYIEKRAKKRRRNRDHTLWGGGKRASWMRERNLDYYRRIVALCKANGIEVAFYLLPAVFAPEPEKGATRQLSETLGVPVYALPYWYTRISFHHYRDRRHTAPDMQPAFAIWFASLIDRTRKS